jgi:2-C-methyl-D-erythritol 2,4-cyclodiphosphate synthase
MSASWRVGHGFDAHRLEAGRALVLGGVRVPHERGLAGHSDADVLCHAAASALLGAMALGDLGRHFPSGDPRWRDADSLDLLRRVVAMVREAGGRCEQIDATVVLEAPRLSPHVDAMRENLARILEVGVDRVSVKATTSDGLGFTGRGEGAAAWAVALVRVGA